MPRLLSEACSQVITLFRVRSGGRVRVPCALSCLEHEHPPLYLRFAGMMAGIREAVGLFMTERDASIARVVSRCVWDAERCSD